MKQKTHKKKTKYPSLSLLGFGILFFYSFAINAQTTLNTTGGTATISGNVYSYSIGEMVLIKTTSTSNNYFTQGLLQNDDVHLQVYDNQYLSGGLEIYPNPVANIVYLKPSFRDGGKLVLLLYDLRGRLVMKHKAELSTGTEKQQLDLSMFQEGAYLLQVSLEQDGQVYRHSFKVIKFSDQ